MQAASSPGDQLRRLESVCLNDMAVLAGLGGWAGGRGALQLTLGRGVRRFAGAMAEFDLAVGQVGVARAARQLARRYGAEIEAADAVRVPTTGPLLLVANHPGLLDSLAIYATAPRPDLVALSHPQPLLTLLPEMVRRHLMFVPDSGPRRAWSVRAMLDRLRRGGAIILFPAGHLEPDPILAHGREPLDDWSPGLGALVRLAARRQIPLQVVPTAVRGALSERIWRRFWPLIRLRRTRQTQADLTAVLQLIFPRLGSTTVRVGYGTPLDAEFLAATSLDAQALTDRIKSRLHELLSPEASDESKD